ncbi:MAG: ribosome-associated translation inhibitor RaiA [Bacteroidota bacterium]
MKVNTQAVHFTVDNKLITFIEKKLSKLELYFDRILQAKVFLKLENTGRVRDKIVEIQLLLPGQTLYAKESSKKFELSIDQVAASLKRQLIKYKDRKRRNRA